MQSPIAPKWLVLTAVSLVMVAPGVPEVTQSPYGVRLPQLWLAILYFASAVFVALVICLRLLRSVLKLSHPWRFLGAFFVFVATPYLTLLLAALPFPLEFGAYTLLGRVAFLSQWSLFNKFLEILVTDATRLHLYLLPATVILGAWLIASIRFGNERGAADPS